MPNFENSYFYRNAVALATVFILNGCLLLDRPSSMYPNSPISFEKAKQRDKQAIPLTTHIDNITIDAEDNEIWSDVGTKEIWARNVSKPTLLPVLPKRNKATGAAVLVIPGGGFQFISLANEGYPIAEWLAKKGIAAFVLKYRTMTTPVNEEEFSKYLQRIYNNKETPIDRSEGEKLATSDAQEALKVIIDQNEEWNIDINRIGVLGFSAGAMTVMNVIQSKESTPKVHFAGYIYGPMTETIVPAQAPPLFVALARDDELFSDGEFGLIESWMKARQPIEFHLYDGGKHGFGSKRNDLTSDLWMEQFYAWLKSQKFIE